jgi:hypothetical protein
MNLRQQNERIQALNPRKAFARLVNDNPTFFIDAIKEQMYTGRHGLKSFVYRSLSYEKQKRRMNPGANGKVDLYLTGQFYSGIRLATANETEMQLTSSDEKTKLLTQKYEGIFKYNKETIARIKPEIVRLTKEYL